MYKKRKERAEIVYLLAGNYDCGFDLVQHPPSSHDFAHSDLNLFPNTKKKKALAGTRFPQTMTFARIKRNCSSTVAFIL